MPAIDFVPDECAALALQACQRALECFLGAAGVRGKRRRVNTQFDIALELRASLDGHAECLLEALQKAYEEAGCMFPAIPSPPEPPDFSDCRQALDDIVERAENPLGFLDGIMTIEFDSNGRMIRITVP